MRSKETGFNTETSGAGPFWFCLGILTSSVSIAFITKVGMGTSQISSVPYAFSLQFPQVSFAMCAFLINFVFAGAQIPLLGKKFFPMQLLHIPVNAVFMCVASRGR